MTDFRKCVLPDREDFSSIIKRVEDSAVGPDGISYSAYSAHLDTSSLILERITEFLSSENQVQGLDVFTRQFVWFPPREKSMRALSQSSAQLAT